MTIPLHRLPDEALDRMVSIPLREYLELYAEAHGEGPMFVDSAWLSSRYGFSLEWWADRARAGDVEAFQDSPGSPWRFDRASCLAHLLRLKGTASKVRQRGPWVEQERRKAG